MALIQSGLIATYSLRMICRGHFTLEILESGGVVSRLSGNCWGGEQPSTHPSVKNKRTKVRSPIVLAAIMCTARYSWSRVESYWRVWGADTSGDWHIRGGWHVWGLTRLEDWHVWGLTRLEDWHVWGLTRLEDWHVWRTNTSGRLTRLEDALACFSVVDTHNRRPLQNKNHGTIKPPINLAPRRRGRLCGRHCQPWPTCRWSPLRKIGSVKFTLCRYSLARSYGLEWQKWLKKDLWQNVLLGRKYLEWTMRTRRDGKWVRQHIPKEEKQ